MAEFKELGHVEFAPFLINFQFSTVNFQLVKQ